MQKPALERRHGFIINRLGRVVVGEIAKNKAERVAQAAVGIGLLAQNLRADTHIVVVIRRDNPEPQYIHPQGIGNLFRRDAVAQRLGHFLSLFVEREAVREHRFIRRLPACAAADQQ